MKFAAGAAIPKIRPPEDLNEMIRQSEQRGSKQND
jgi:hypothetical protein